MLNGRGDLLFGHFCRHLTPLPPLLGGEGVLFDFKKIVVMLEKVTEWLAGARAYWDGVGLYEVVGESGFLKTLFRKTEDDYNHAKLADVLQAWVEAQVIREAEQLDAMPEPLKNKLDVARSLMDERAALKERLRVYYQQDRPAGELKAGAFRILDIGKELDGIYSEKRFWNQTGYLPERATQTEETAEQLLNRRNTLRTYVTKYRKSGAAEKLQRYESELWEVDEKLKAHGVV